MDSPVYKSIARSRSEVLMWVGNASGYLSVSGRSKDEWGARVPDASQQSDTPDATPSSLSS